MRATAGRLLRQASTSLAKDVPNNDDDRRALFDVLTRSCPFFTTDPPSLGDTIPLREPVKNLWQRFHHTEQLRSRGEDTRCEMREKFTVTQGTRLAPSAPEYFKRRLR
jgi:hypothetical protein